MVVNMIAKEFINEQLGIKFQTYIDKECCVWFKAKEVAEILGYKKSRNAIEKHVSEKYKKGAPIQGPLGGEQNCIIINEAGFYELVFKSKLPAAQIFREWVFEKVLPSIRKDGYYHLDRRVIIDGKKYYKHPVFSNYAVSKNGIIYNVKNEKQRKMCTNNSGYQVFTMYNKQLRKTISYTQHRFVYEVFNGPVTKFFEIDHINNDRTDNRIRNLQLLTRKENIKKKNF